MAAQWQIDQKIDAFVKAMDADDEAIVKAAVVDLTKMVLGDIERITAALEAIANNTATKA